ncbi:MAG: ROK family protein [Oscillospiraceae bacterium]|nr:ROK family protein [Oscillospiraceae bacterium]
MNLKVKAVLDKDFSPMSEVYREFQQNVKKSGKGEALVIGIVRNKGYVSAFPLTVFKDGISDELNCKVVDRMVKSLLWVRGGYKIVIAGSKVIGDYIKAAYSKGGSREFDVNFMSRVYERPFEVENICICEAPATVESATPVGRHLAGCRIGFDAGGSDRKVSAVIDGDAVFSEEVVWHPKLQSDPKYHFDGIRDSMKTAAKHMPRVDGIGVSTAGVCIDNRIMVASLFIKVSDEDFDKYVKNIYLNVAKELGDNIPIEVANDGDVTALAGAMDLDDDCVLGIAMGTSEAGGYVDENGNITGWLNELAFVPVDFNENAMTDEWSGDYGCGVKYFSQDAVIKLAPAAGIELDASFSPAEKLKVVQELMKNKDERARRIYETIGVYFGYEVAFYALFYKIKHVLTLGRVTSGDGGVILLEKANEVLKTEYPELYSSLELNIPDESSRRVGQSIAAASLPE